MHFSKESPNSIKELIKIVMNGDDDDDGPLRAYFHGPKKSVFLNGVRLATEGKGCEPCGTPVAKNCKPVRVKSRYEMAKRVNTKKKHSPEKTAARNL